jgi:hypothetical protein
VGYGHFGQRVHKARRCFCRYQTTHSLAAEGTYSAEGGRQKQWSDDNYLFPELYLSHVNKGNVGVAAGMCRQSSILIAFCSTKERQQK